MKNTELTSNEISLKALLVPNDLVLWFNSLPIETQRDFLELKRRLWISFSEECDNLSAYGD